MSLPDFEYTNTQLQIRAIVVFFVAVFSFLALGTEIIDIGQAYLSISISPKLALTLIANMYIFVWMILGLSENIGSQPRKGPIAFMVFMIMFTLFSYVIAETPLGVLVFGEFSEKMKTTNLVTNILTLIVLSGHAAITDYMRNQPKYEHKPNSEK